MQFIANGDTAGSLEPSGVSFPISGILTSRNNGLCKKISVCRFVSWPIMLKYFDYSPKCYYSV